MRLTKTVIDRIQTPDKDSIVWDNSLAGFGVRVSPKGTKSYLIQYRAGSKTRRHTIGRTDHVTLDAARKSAKSLLGEVARGRDPGLALSRIKSSPTFMTFADIFIREHVEVKLKPLTQSDYKHAISKHLLPTLGSMKLESISKKDIHDFHLSLKHTPYQANKCVSVLSKMFNFAEQHEYTHEKLNPCRYIEPYKEKRRMRYLDKAELKRLWDTLDHMETREDITHYAANAYRMLILTGCRLGEIRTLKWAFLRGDHMELPDTKTGYRRIPLNDAALRVTRGVIRQENNEYMFCGNVQGQPIVNLQKSWRRVRIKAGLPDVRIHDLRHTFASQALMNGTPLAIISKLLGHSSIKTTMRYAHLADQELAKASNHIGQILDFS